MTIQLSSPNFITSQLFDEAARQLDEMRDGEDNSARFSSVIILTMAALESFLNSYFHKLVFQLGPLDYLLGLDYFLNQRELGSMQSRRNLTP